MRRRSLLWLAIGVPSGLLLFTLGAAAGWWYWTGTVYYSLRQLERAFKTHDRYLVEKHVDLPHLTRQMVDEMFEEGMKELADEPLSPLEQAVAPLGIAFAQMLKPRLVEEIQFAITRGIETGSVGGSGSEPAPTGADQTADVVAEFRKDIPRLRPDKLLSVHSHGTTATVELAGLLEGVPQTQMDVVPNIHIRFVRTPDRFWKATEVENFKDLLKFWKGMEEKQLAAANEPVKKMIKQSLAVVDVTKEQGLNSFGTGKDAWVVVTLRNETGSGLQGMIADVTVRDEGGELKKVQIQDIETIPPHETARKVWPLNLDLINNVDLLVYNADPARLKISVEFRHLAFSDGTEMKLAESLDEVVGAKKPAVRQAAPAPAGPADAVPIQSL